jgi:hypothetical protein
MGDSLIGFRQAADREKSSTGISRDARTKYGRSPRRWAYRSRRSSGGRGRPPRGRGFGRSPCAPYGRGERRGGGRLRITPDGPRVEGLTVETAARLLTLLR